MEQGHFYVYRGNGRRLYCNKEKDKLSKTPPIISEGEMIFVFKIDDDGWMKLITQTGAIAWICMHWHAMKYKEVDFVLL